MRLTRFYKEVRFCSRDCKLRFFVLAIFLLHATYVCATVPTGFTETLVAGGVNYPTSMAIAPDGRIFVCLQAGSLRVIKNGSLLPTPFLTVTVSSTGERGLQSVVFDPNFASNQYVYVYYTATTPTIHNRLSRFTANGDVAVPGSEFVLMDLDNLGSTNHNGGALHFGIDGKLYIAVGDNAVASNAQTLANLHGKILRLNSDGSIPTDNPFYGTATGKNRAIWALGLRNPFTFDIQPATGRMFINDVGAASWEEINDGVAGGNYGWPTYEGMGATFINPLYTYGHGTGGTLGCAITGGAFYNPQTVQFPSSYVGKYFFGDYCNQSIRTYDPVTDTAASFATVNRAIDLDVDSNGTLYYLSWGSAGVYKVQYTASQAPSITTHPANLTVSQGQPATFSVTASGTPPLTYQWQRNGSNISGATSSSYTLSSAQSSDNGAQFRCKVTNSFGNVTSNAATLTVTSNTAPVATITQPLAGTTYVAGNTINYAGTGTDSQDGTLAGSAFTWQVDFHHDTHTHPFIPPTTGSKTGSFVIPTSGETSANVWYRIHLTVKDSGNLTHSVYRDVVPVTANVTLATAPTGLQVKLDGQPHTAPYSFLGVAGIIRTVEAVSPQTVGPTTYLFLSWSDAGAQSHNISTPSSNTTYTATFNAKPTISITSPANGASFIAPASITINANASDTGGTIQDVKFYQGATLLNTDASSPYSFTWNNVGTGSYTLTAQARDNNNAVTTSAAINVTVNPPGNVPPTVSITSPANGATFAALSDITINANASDSDGTVSKVEFFQGSTLLGTDTTNPYSYTWNNVPAGSYTLTAKAFDNSSATKISNGVNISVTGGGTLPAPWQNSDIGPVSFPGSASFASGNFSVNASGADIWDTSDQFHYVYQTLNGNGEISAYVADVENTNNWAKAGVMIRETISANSKHAMMALTPMQGAAFQRRVTAGAGSASTTLGTIRPPYWVKVMRNGSTFTGFISSNGASWNQVGSTTISMGNSVFIGLALTSHNNSTVNTSLFSSVVVSASASFSDDFQDGDISDWTPSNGVWSVISGNLIGSDPKKGSIFSKIFTGCSVCTLEADMEVQTAGAKVSVLGWRQDKQNVIELMMDEAKDKWVLKIRSAGQIREKIKFDQAIETFTNYHVKITFTGTSIIVTVGSTTIFDTPAVASPGNIGFKIKAGTGSFRQIKAN